MQRWTFHRKGQGEVFSDVVAVERRHRVYCFGGHVAKDGSGKRTYHIKAQAFDTVSLCWEESQGKSPPCVCTCSVFRCAHPRYGYDAVLMGEACIYLLGGQRDARRLLAFDADDHGWSTHKLSGTIPKGRWNHNTACVLGKFIYFLVTRQTNDMYKLDTSTMVWTLIDAVGTPPYTSGGYSAIIIGTKIFVLGGWETRQGFYNCNRISPFDTETEGWLSTPREQETVCVCSFFAHNGELYSLGFSDSDSVPLLRYCLRKFCPETFSWKGASLPKAKGRFSMAGTHCCMVGDRVIFFKRSKPFDLCILDLSPSLKTLSKLAVLQYGMERSGLPHNIRWELVAMATKNSTQNKLQERELV